jgi:hypothetical protein
MHARLLVAFSLVCLALAGCLADEGSDEPGVDPRIAGGVTETSAQRLPDPAQDFSGVVVTDHGAPGLHTVRALHGGSSGLELAGYDPLTDKMPPGAAGTGWGAAGLWGTYACVAQWLGSGAIAIVDLADPSDPTVVSQVDDPLVNGDCQFTADGKYLFAGAYLSAAGTAGLETEPDCRPALASGCPAGGGINVWDVQDKAAPRHILFTDTGEYHTLQVHTDPATNVTYVIQAYSGHIYRFEPEGPALVEVTQLQPMEHDMWIDKHPVTGDWLLYTGNSSGFIAYDFNDPAQPKVAGEWQPDDSLESQSMPGCCAWHRQAQLPELIDGRAILVAAGEDCGGGNEVPYFVFDVTDITQPFVLSSFDVPGDIRADTMPTHLCEFTAHEFSMHDGYVITANYHAGAWLFDIGSPERLLDPVVLGYYIPANEPLVEEPGFGAQDLSWPWNPFVWGAFFDERGYVLAGDFSSGLYLLEIPGVTQAA